MHLLINYYDMLTESNSTVTCIADLVSHLTSMSSTTVCPPDDGETLRAERGMPGTSAFFRLYCAYAVEICKVNKSIIKFIVDNFIPFLEK